MDAPLCAGLQGFILVNAAEIMRYTYVEEHNENGWTYKDTEQTEDMFRNVFLPILSEFYKTKPYTNGNWGIAVTKAQIGISVFLMIQNFMMMLLISFIMEKIMVLYLIM